MSAELSAVVAEHGGKPYIKLITKTWYPDTKHIAANGVSDLPKAPGDDSFLLYDGAPVETLEKITPPRRIVTKYVLREDLIGSPKEEVVSVDQYRALSESDQALYRAVHEDIPQEAEPVPFVIQKEDGPPSTLPEGVVCTDKNYYARFPSFWHLGPVRATDRYVLYRVALRLQEIIGDNPYIAWSSCVDPLKDILRSRYSEAFFISAKPLIVNGIQVSPTGLKSMFHIKSADRSHYGQLVPAVEAANLEELEKRVSAVVEKLTEQARKWAIPNACPCCQRRYAKRKSA